MNLYAIHEQEALATLHTDLAARKKHGHTVEEMFEKITQHPAAMIASAAEEFCPYCCAQPFEGCRPDCSSFYDN